MNIKVSNLKKFQKLSSHIRPAGITPASSCIKFCDGKLIKNANSAFIEYDCQDATDNVLVDENVLNSLLKNTISDIISISVIDKKLILSDGRDKISSGIIPVKEFVDPIMDKSKRRPISNDFLDSLRRSSGACMPYKSQSSLYMFVHIGGKLMAAGNGFMGVCFPIEEDYTMVLEKSVAALVANYEIVSTSETSGHYFFYAENFTLGFSKQEIGFCEMGKMMQCNNKITFTISACDITSFNSLALSLCKDYSIVTIDSGKLEMIDFRIDSAPIREIPGLKLPEPFHYNAEFMNQLITAFGVETLDFHYSEKAYFIKSPDSKASAIIAKISK